MKTLQKLKVKAEKVIRSEELILLKGGYAYCWCDVILNDENQTYIPYFFVGYSGVGSCIESQQQLYTYYPEFVTIYCSDRP